jgi:hypothetical protein
LSVRDSLEASPLKMIPTSPRATEPTRRSKSSRRFAPTTRCSRDPAEDFDLAPAERARQHLQLALQPLALQVLTHLCQRRWETRRNPALLG